MTPSLPDSKRTRSLARRVARKSNKCFREDIGSAGEHINKTYNVSVKETAVLRAILRATNV